LCAEHVDVVEIGKLLRGEGLGWTKDHVSGVVDDDIEVAVLGDDLLDCRVGRLLRRDIQLNGPQLDLVVGGVLLCGLDLRRIPSGGLAHAGVDGVTRPGESTRRESSKAARCAGNDNDAFHDFSLHKNRLAGR
jgi:hypothetical protein